MSLIEGDLLEIKADFIVHQTNCLTVRSHGLAAVIAKKWPQYDIYATRKAEGQRNRAVAEDRGIPGSIETFDDHLVCFMAQWRPGKIGSKYFHVYPESDPPETTATRQQWFQSCLALLAQNLAGKAVSVAFPFRIGCGLAKGNWDVYRGMIETWAQTNPNLTVWLVKLPGEK